MAESAKFLDFGFFSVYWYGLIIGAGLLAAMLLFSSLRKAQGEDFRGGFTLAFASLPAALVCGRIFYCWFGRPMFPGGMKEFLDLTTGGNAFYGAVAGLLAVVGIYCLCSRKSMLVLLDAASPAVALALAVGRFAGILCGSDKGFVLEGNDFSGTVYVVWSEQDNAWFLWVGFYEGIAAIVTLCATLAVFVRKYLLKGKKHASGDAALAFMLFHGLSQSILESMRDDSLYMSTIGFVRISQIISFLLAIAAFVIVCVRVIRTGGLSLKSCVTAVMVVVSMTIAVVCEFRMNATSMGSIYFIMGYFLVAALLGTSALYLLCEKYVL